MENDMMTSQDQLISKLITLEEQANADSSEYLKLIKMHENVGASFDDSKISRLREKILNLRRQIVVFRRHLRSVSEVGARSSFC